MEIPIYTQRKHDIIQFYLHTHAVHEDKKKRITTKTKLINFLFNL